MIQQINLYRLLHKQTGMYLTREVVLLSYGAVATILLIVFLIALLQKNHLNTELSKRQAQNTILQDQLQVLTTKYPISNPDDLKTSIQELKAHLINKIGVIDVLSQDANFSAYMIGIAKSTITGTWLNEIIFNKTDKKIILKGFTLNRSLLERFLSGLQAQPEFHDFIFSLDEFTETTQPATFTLSTKQAQTV